MVSDEVLPTKVQTDDVLPGESGGGIIEGAASEESGEDIANTSKTGDEAVQAGEAPLIEKDASEETADEESSDTVEKQEEGADSDSKVSENTELEGVLSLGGKTLVPGTDFKIISTGYSNNVKKGTARVTG